MINNFDPDERSPFRRLDNTTETVEPSIAATKLRTPTKEPGDVTGAPVMYTRGADTPDPVFDIERPVPDNPGAPLGNKFTNTPQDTSPAYSETSSTSPEVKDPGAPSGAVQTPITDQTTSGSGSTSTATRDEATRKTVESILADPHKYLTDRDLVQKYTEQKVMPDEFMDPTVYQAGAIDPLKAATASAPTTVASPTATAATASAPTTVTASTSSATTAADAPKVTAGTVSGTTAEAAKDTVVKDFEASLIDTGSLTKVVDKLAETEPMKAASMASHLDSLLTDLESGNVPVWARPAVTKVEQMLAARGISASSVGRDSLFNAIIQAAMPIAQQDATFEQDANKTNYNAKVQAILTDANTEFVAKQFNATSINQTNQFLSQLKAQVDMQNAARKDAMSQFNASELNKIGMFNAGNQLQADITNAQLSAQTAQFNASEVNKVGMANASNQLQASVTNAQLSAQTAQFNASEVNKVGMFNASNQLQASQFNAQASMQTAQFNASQVNAMTQLSAQLNAQRDQFNVQMAAQIEQSNVNWRRQVNTANTAGINAVNQANVQNAFNLSNQALTFLWQEMRDKAHWEFQASESEKDRKNQLEAALLANEAAMGGEIGKFLEGITQGTKFLSGFLSSWK